MVQYQELERDSSNTIENRGGKMLSKKWCYYSSPESNQYSILHVSRPITKKQAIFLIKKKLKVSKIYYIVDCN